MLTMLLVDDEYLVRKGISETIEWNEYGIQVIGEAADGNKGLELAKKFNPDIIITDIRMPIMDGLEFMTNLKENGLSPGIIVLSGFEEFSYARTAMNNGALAYLLKPIDNDQLIETVQKVAKKIIDERANKQYVEKIKNELPSITKQFLIDLVSGDIKDINTINEKVIFLNLSLLTDKFYILVLKIDEYDILTKQLSVDEIYKFKELINKLISEIFLKNTNYSGLMINKLSDEILIFLNTKYNPEKDVDDIKNLCIVLIESLKKEYSQTISIGISSLCNNVLYMNYAYKEAETASQCKIIHGSSSVIYIKEISTNGYRREVREAINYIQSNYSKDITIELVAKELFISPSHLMHLFKKELGKTFNDCLTDYRISIGKKLLQNRKYKIYEVSTSIGYGDVKYFSQIFKKTTGMTPSEYIKSQA